MWSAKYAQINTGLFHAIYFGNTGQPTAGAYTAADTESQTIPGSPYGLATTNAANFIQDLGVRYSTTGINLSVTNTSPVTGTYIAAPAGAPDFQANTAVTQGYFIQPVTGNAGNYVYMALSSATTPGSAPVWTQGPVGSTVTSTPNWLIIGTKGNYLFAAGDTTKVVWIDYVYQPAYGYRTTFTSQQLGNAPQFAIVARGVFSGAPLVVRFDNCISGKLSIPRKVEDWVILQMDGEAFVGGNNIGGYFYTNEAL